MKPNSKLNYRKIQHLETLEDLNAAQARMNVYDQLTEHLEEKKEKEVQAGHKVATTNLLPLNRSPATPTVAASSNNDTL